MNKCNKNIDALINSLITEVMNKEGVNDVKIDIIKEEIRNNNYQINSKNIAKRIQELSPSYEEEITA